MPSTRTRDYVVTASNISDGNGRNSSALTRDAIRLEVAMRVIATGKKTAKQAWSLSDDFIEEMDSRLPPLPDELLTNKKD